MIGQTAVIVCVNILVEIDESFDIFLLDFLSPKCKLYGKVYPAKICLSFEGHFLGLLSCWVN